MARREHKKLAKEAVGVTRRRSVFAAFVMPIVVVLCVNFAVVPWNINHPLNHSLHLLVQKWNTVRTLDEKQDILIFGDSSCLNGVNAKQLGNSIGLRAWNHALFADCLLLNPAWMLAESIERHGAPRAAMIVVTYDIWHRHANPNLFGHHPLPWRFWNESQTQYSFDLTMTLHMALYRFFPLYNDFANLANLVKYPWYASEYYGEIESWYNENERGFMRRRVDPVDVVADTRLQHERARVRTGFRISEENATALCQISDLAMQHGFPVFVANGPLYEGLFGDAIFNDYFSKVNTGVKETIHGLPGLIFFDKLYTFDLEYMGDSVEHLSGEGAAVFTDSLVIDIRRVSNL